MSAISLPHYSSQTIANRLNAIQSTGPRTAQGKARSSRNALAHGLRSQAPVIAGEEMDEWLAFQAGIIQSLQPIGTLENELAAKIALLLWRQRRILRYETGVVNQRMDFARQQLRLHGSRPGIPLTERPNHGPHMAPDNTSHLANPTTFGDMGNSSPGMTDTVNLAHRLERLEIEDQDAAWMVEQLDHLLKLEKDHQIERAFEFLERMVYDPARMALDFQRVDTIELLRAAGVPQEWHNLPEAWPGWTAAHVKNALLLIAVKLTNGNREEDEEFSEPQSPSRQLEILEAFLVQRRESYISAQSFRDVELELYRRELAKARDVFERAENQIDSELCLANEGETERIVRYETHLSRELSRTLDTFEQVRGLRTRTGPVDVDPPRQRLQRKKRAST